MGIKDAILANIRQLQANDARGGTRLTNAELWPQLQVRVANAANNFIGMKLNSNLLVQLSHSLQQGVEGFCRDHDWYGEVPQVIVEDNGAGEFTCRIEPRRPIEPTIRMVRQ